MIKLKYYISLYKLTGYCPSWLTLRIYKYALKRLKNMQEPAYYITQPAQALELWVSWYEERLGLYRSSFLKELKRMIWRK